MGSGARRPPAAAPRAARPPALFPRLHVVPEVEGEVLVRPGLDVAGEAGLDAGVVALPVAEEAGIFPLAVALLRRVAGAPARPLLLHPDRRPARLRDQPALLVQQRRAVGA